MDIYQPGPTEFTQLSDVPNTYSGQADKFVAVNSTPSGLIFTPSAGVVPLSKTLTYNGDGTLNVVSDSSGTKTMGYTVGVLTSITGTGIYKNKTFSYTGGQLTSVTVF